MFFRSRLARLPWLSLVLLVAATNAGSGSADEIDVRLATAKTEHAHALAEAHKTLEADVSKGLEALAQSGNYDVVKKAAAERDAMLKEGILPISEVARPAVAKYVEARRGADSALFNIYRECVADLTRELKLDRAGVIDEEMKKFVESERALLAAGRTRPEETATPVVSDRSPETIRGKLLRERHLQSCRELAEAFAELERAVASARALDTTTRRSAAYATASTAAIEKINGTAFEICYRIDDVAASTSDRRTVLEVSMDYRPAVVDHVPMTGFLKKIEVPVPRTQADEIAPGAYVYLKGTIDLKARLYLVQERDGYRPRVVYYRCVDDDRWYGGYLDVNDFRIVAEVPEHLKSETKVDE